MAAGFREGFVEADGFRIRYMEAGERAGTRKGRERLQSAQTCRYWGDLRMHSIAPLRHSLVADRLSQEGGKPSCEARGEAPPHSMTSSARASSD